MRKSVGLGGSRTVLAAMLFFVGPTLVSGATMSSWRIALSGDLPPLRMTYQDVFQLVGDLEKLIADARVRGQDRGDCIFTYQIRAREIALRSNSLEELYQDPNLPSPAYSFEIFCFPYREAIYSIEILLTNHHSSYSVIGKDKDLLHALQKQIESFARRYKTRFGGNGCRYTVFILINLFAGGLYGVGLYEIVDRKKKTRWNIGLIAGGCILLFADFFILSAGYLDYWFPNTAVYFWGDPPMERNRPLLLFWSILLATVGLLLALVVARRRWSDDS